MPAPPDDAAIETRANASAGAGGQEVHGSTPQPADGPDGVAAGNGSGAAGAALEAPDGRTASDNANAAGAGAREDAVAAAEATPPPDPSGRTADAEPRAANESGHAAADPGSETARALPEAPKDGTAFEHADADPEAQETAPTAAVADGPDEAPPLASGTGNLGAGAGEAPFQAIGTAHDAAGGTSGTVDDGTASGDANVVAGAPGEAPPSGSAARAAHAPGCEGGPAVHGAEWRGETPRPGPAEELAEAPPADAALFAYALRVAEALVFASDRPVTAARLQGALPPDCDARAVLTALAASCAGRPVRLVEVAGGFAFRTAPELAPAITRVVEVPRRLPRAAMETLAIVAYHQPVTRAEIEEIRGASLSQSTLELLLDAALIAPRGRKEVPGRPSLWGTTPRFLEQFGLKALGDLPRREELVNEPTLPLGAPQPPAAA